MKRILIFIAVWLLTTHLQAQVTIGSDTSPAGYSILELISSGNKGLRLPQVNSHVRDSLTIEFTTGINLNPAQKDLALGLQIFNIDNLCVETWNGAEWISACAMCGDQPCVYYPPSGVSPNGSITTFVNVMYDFQHQTIEAYDFADTPPPVSYQWYAKRSGAADTEYKGIYGATAITYTVPADFVKNIFQPLVSDNDENYNDNIVFVCLAKYSDGTYKQSAGMDILFIGTNTGGYGYDIIDGKKFRYLTLKKAVSGGTLIDFKVALLNLGQSADWDGNSQTETGNPPVYIPNNDAGDLGDFYQWGRVADGHQNVAWKKGINHIDTITPFLGGANTSDTVSYKRNPSFPDYDGNHQVSSDDATYYGNFINAATRTSFQGGDYDWYNPNNGGTSGHDNGLWGIGSNDSNRNSDILLALWTYLPNNPCPSGWRVPSRWNFWDLYKGTGVDELPGSGNYGGSNNIWTHRPMENPDITNNFTIGGALITNDAGEILFLPASGLRGNNNGALNNIGSSGHYWSSTYSSISGNNYAYGLGFGSDYVSAGNYSHARAVGYSVRCVQAVPAP